MNFKNSEILKNATANMFFNNDHKKGGEIMMQVNKPFFKNGYAPELGIINNDLLAPSQANELTPLGAKSSHGNFSPMHVTHMVGNSFPSLITPQILSHKKPQSGKEEYNKQAINLEDLWLQEQKLCKILESLRCNSNVSISCEEWLDFINYSSIQSLESYFMQLETKLHINTFSIFEIVSVMSIIISIIKNKLNENTVSHLKNLIFNIHQNYLILINLILIRLPKEFTKNSWKIKLQDVIREKQIKVLENDDIYLFKQNNKFIANIINKYICLVFKNKNDSKIHEILNDLLVNSDKYTYPTVKSILFNMV
jgi:hypothetical protein